MKKIEVQKVNEKIEHTGHSIGFGPCNSSFFFFGKFFVARSERVICGYDLLNGSIEC